MNTKKIAFFFMALIATYTPICTQDTMAPALATEQQISAEQWQQLTDLHEKIMDQTSKIEFCLQTVDQIITNNKIKVDTSKISKSELLEQIRQIQEMIQSFSQISIAAMQNGSYDIIEQGMSFNQACIDYLLPIFTNEITSIDAENFNNAIMRKFKNFNELANNTPIEQQIENSQKQIDQLIVASENVGLSIFNKVYRYLDRQPLPISGKSTFATMYDLGKLSTIALSAYLISLYAIPNNLQIPYLNISSNDLPLRKNIGAANISDYIWAPNIDPEKKQKILAGHNSQDSEAEVLGLKEGGIGYLGTFDYALRVTGNPLVAYTTPLLVAAAYPYYESAYKYSKKKMDNLLAYYGHGDASQNIANQEYVKAYFKDIVGGQELEKEAKLIADYIKNPVRYERQGNSPATGYLLVGPSQTGKSFFARALRTLIDEQFVGTQQKVGFIDVRAIEVEKLGFAQIFEIASSIAPVILFIDELDMYGVRRARNDTRTQELVTAMNGMNTNPNKKVIVIAATNRPEELDFALKEKGRFGNILTFNYPNYESRQHYLKKQLKKYNIALSESMIDTISQETDGKTFNMIDDIIRQARQLSTYKLRPVQEQDFEITLDKEIRKIKPNVTMSQVEEELVAIYQAGVAVARYVLPTERKVVKITIDAVEKPMASKEGQDIKTEEKGVQHENAELVQQERIKYNRLGYVFTSSTMNHNELIDDTEQEKEMIALLSGQAALELIKGKTFNSFGKEDRAKVLDYLEKKISEGTQVTNEIRQQAIKAKDALYLQAKATLQPHINFIKTVAGILTKQRAINKFEWAELTNTLQKSAAAASKIMPTRLQNKRPLAVAKK